MTHAPTLEKIITRYIHYQSFCHVQLGWVFNWVSKVIRVFLWFRFADDDGLTFPAQNQNQSPIFRMRIPVLDSSYRYFYLLPFLIGLFSFLFLWWVVKGVLWFLVYDTQLKTALRPPNIFQWANHWTFLVFVYWRTGSSFFTNWDYNSLGNSYFFQGIKSDPVGYVWFWWFVLPGPGVKEMSQLYKE